MITCDIYPEKDPVSFSSVLKLPALFFWVVLSVYCVDAFAADVEIPKWKESGKQSYGEVVYVPAYSSIYHQDRKREIPLTVTLNIHNVSSSQSISIVSVDFYNKKGDLVKRFLERPDSLGKFETKSYVIDEKDISGGVGANFIVKWESDKPCQSPFIDTVMISTVSSLGISFTNPGTVIKRRE